MLLFLLVFFLLSSCFEPIDIVGTNSEPSAPKPVTLLNANNDEILLSKQQVKPTTLYVNQAQGVTLALNLPNARGISFVNIRKIKPAGDTLRKELSQPGFSHFFQLVGNEREQLYGISQQNGEEFYIKITSQPTMIVDFSDQSLYQEIPYILSFAGTGIKIGFEGVQNLNDIQILPYNFSDSLVNGSTIFLEYQGEKVVDVAEMIERIKQESGGQVSDLYQLRINTATDILGHRSFRSGSYYLRQINHDTPLHYSVYFDSEEGLQKGDIKFCSNSSETEPCSTEEESLGLINFGSQSKIFLEGVSISDSSYIEGILEQPFAVEQSFGEQVQLSSSIFQKKSDSWENYNPDDAASTLLSDDDLWLMPQLEYRESDLLAYDAFFQISVKLPQEYIYSTQKLSFRFPCSRLVVQEANSKEYRSLDDYKKYAALHDDRAGSLFADDASFPSSLGRTALASSAPAINERQVCTDYTGGEYDNYYILPSGSQSDKNQWKALKFALAWDERWNYKDFNYSFIAERKKMTNSGVEWNDITLSEPAESTRYTTFNLLEDVLEDEDKQTILLYRLKPVIQHKKIEEARYTRPINYYFLRYPQLYPGMKKLSLENDNKLFIDLEASFLRNSTSSSLVKSFFESDKDTIRGVIVEGIDYYLLESNSGVATLTFFIPTDDGVEITLKNDNVRLKNDGDRLKNYDDRLKNDRRKVEHWSVKSEASDNVELAFTENNYNASLSKDGEDLTRDRILEVKARKGREPACSRIITSLVMSDGEATSSEFFLCVS